MATFRGGGGGIIIVSNSAKEGKTFLGKTRALFFPSKEKQFSNFHL